VSYVVTNGMMVGTEGNTFSPKGTVTRGTIMTVLARYAGQDTSGGSVWYEKGMDWAVSAGVSDGTKPTASITREQLATMLWRYAGEPQASADLSAYADADTVSSYATDAMNWAVETGLINGISGKLAPKGTATRAQVATIMMRYCTNVAQ
jgi:hypothetical protein